MSTGDELLEYSVIYTQNAINLMAASFSQAYKDISKHLCDVYQADHCVLIPGSGSYAMEAVVGQYGRYKTEPNYAPGLVIRNGYFSYRWTDIWEWVYHGDLDRSPELIVVKANPTEADNAKPSFAPPSIEEAVEQIKTNKPCVVFAPHVETSAGIIITDEYIKALADATHEYGGPDAIFVLDCVASGNVWAKMKDLGIDIIITAPQKGWTSPASVGIAMMSARAKDIMAASSYPASDNHPGWPNRGHSFCCNLAKWSLVADKYAAPGGFAYHTTLPTDALMTFRDVIVETIGVGLEDLEKRTIELGARIRSVLESKGFKSVAAEGFKAPTVVVSYIRDESDRDLVARFKKNGVQIAAGVPLKVDEPWEGAPPTFRIGLFGLDKLRDVDLAVKRFEDALAKVLAE